MGTRIPLLTNVRVAAPCPASWSLMTEVDGDRVRFCDSCKLNVYNLSAMTQAEAEGLLRAHEGRLCVRYYERPDGTILTRNCPIGAQALRVKMIRQSVSAAFILLVAALYHRSPAPPVPTVGRVAPLPPTHASVISPVAPPKPVTPLQGEAIVGKLVSHREATHPSDHRSSHSASGGGISEITPDEGPSHP